MMSAEHEDRGTHQRSPVQTWQGAWWVMKENCLAPPDQVVARAAPPCKTDCIFDVTDAPLLGKT